MNVAALLHHYPHAHVVRSSQAEVNQYLHTPQSLLALRQMVHHFPGGLDWLESAPAFQKCFGTRDVERDIGLLHSERV